MYTKATVFVPPSLVEQVRELAATAAGIPGMWSFPVSPSGTSPATAWMHSGWFGNQFFEFFTNPSRLSSGTGLTLEQASSMQSSCQVVIGDWVEGLSTSGLKIIPKVDINEASQEELELVNGIGESKAKAIVAGRPWGSVLELSSIAGISLDQAKELTFWYSV